MPGPVIDAVRRHLDLETHIGGYEAYDAAYDRIRGVYTAVGRLVHAAPRNIAVVENATVAFAQALSAFDFARDDVIVTTRNDYISNQLMYLSLAERLGVRIVRASDLPEGGVDPQWVDELIREHRPKLVAVTWIPTNSGLVQPVADVGRICAAHDVPYLVDACQAVGQIEIDATAIPCDFLAATARKFLRGPRGVGFLYVSDRMLEENRAPLLPDMRGARWLDADRYELADDASRFENWEFAYALVLGLGAAAEYALAADVAAAGAYAAGLAAYAREQLAGVDGVRVLDRGPQLAAIVTAELRDMPADRAVVELREQAINTSATFRENAVIDMDEKQARSALRISPHYYNTRREIDTLVGALESLLVQ